ncbi:hypothetical protein [Nocardia asiatica]|uniref:hypothetical protein n=1 Tax=Nocardia asiatica TaxID=209252 RepID=UPI002455D5E1|nr:hypothetical protein [Nocardia asiatica]
MDSQIAELARLIDPDAWAAKDADQVTLGSRFEMTTRRMNSERAAERITAAGYAVVKLPGAYMDGWGTLRWTVDGADCGHVQVEMDGRIGINSVGNPVKTPHEALSLAAALIAAARHVQSAG